MFGNVGPSRATQLLSFFAYNPAFTGGVRVAAGDDAAMVRADISPAPARWQAGGHRLQRSDSSRIDTFFAFDQRFSGGL